MATISWIEEALIEFEEVNLDSLVDRREAVRIAFEEDIWTINPVRQVYAFVSALPSLFKWFGHNYRDFPWRRTHDPWEVLSAEILLQRTHADQVARVYDAFLDQFPEPEAVYLADRDQVFAAVEMLGFGNHKTNTFKALADSITEEHGGEIPDDLGTLQELPRIGPYTARACLCFAYGRPYALIDANVATVVEHVFGYRSRRRPHKDRTLYAFLDALIPHQADAARIFNLSLIDLREQVCRASPCGLYCPLDDACLFARPHPN